MAVYYLLLIVLVAIGIFTFYKVVGRTGLTHLNVFSWTFFVEFLAMATISPFIVMDIKSANWALKNIPDSEFPLKEVILTLSWCTIGIPSGIYIAKKLFQMKNADVDFEKYIRRDYKVSSKNWYLIFWILIFSFYSYYLVRQIGFIPQIEMLGMQASEIAMLRGRITHHLPANIIIFRLVGLTLSAIICYTSFSRFLKKKTWSHAFFFFIFLTLTIFFNTLNLNKSALAYIFVGLIATMGLSSINLNMKKYVSLGVLLLTLLLIGFKLTIPHHSYSSVLTNIFGRITISQSYGNYISFYLFPKYEDHIGFRSITKQLKRVGIEPKERASRIMMKHVAPEQVQKGTAGNMVSTFFAEAWANWGFIGVLLSPFLVGFLLKCTVTLITLLPKSELTIGILSFLTYTFGLNKSISKILLPRYLIAATVISLVLYAAHERLSSSKS
ncbi:MAG: hypothetical protein CME65_04440 [Halobacteriovoraceae bacterium]|nr:hypothetical protein [Halobacteriovoraceae bacterium]|tara:strand:+ start:2663 stop:3985 length:1323 start_codon:yes stop_codon:yes gene_type:complete